MFFFLSKIVLLVFFLILRVRFIIVLEIKIGTVGSSWDSLSASQTRQTKRTDCCVLVTPNTLEPRYLILSTSPALTTEDTSSTTTAGLIHRILRGILCTPGLASVKWKCTVRILQGCNLGNETRVSQCKKKETKTYGHKPDMLIHVLLV